MTSNTLPLQIEVAPNIGKIQRSQTIDILKGIAMCLVLWGHSLQYTACGHFDFFKLPAFRFIYSFHMPLFALVSGYLLGMSINRRKFTDNVNHKIQSIFWPIITANLLCIPLVILPKKILSILMVGGTSNSFMSIAHSLLNGYSLSGFWFLWTVLYCSISACIIFQGMKRPFTKLLAALLCLMFTLQFPCGKLIFNMFPFFIVGALFGEENMSMLATHSVWLDVLIVLAFMLVLPLYKDRAYIYRPIYLKDISFVHNVCIYAIRLGCGFLGSLSIAILVKYLLCLRTNRRLKPLRLILLSLKDCIAFIGANSLKFYIFQSLFFDGGWLSFIVVRVPIIMPSFLFVYDHKIIYQFIFTPIVAFLVAVGLYAIIFFMDKRKFAQWLWRP